MEADKLDKLAQFALANTGYLLAITIPAVSIVAAFIIWMYETFRVKATQEAADRLKASKEQLEKERDALKATNEAVASNLQATVDRFDKERGALKLDIERLTVQHAEALRSAADADRREQATRSLAEAEVLNSKRGVQSLLDQLAAFQISGKKEVALSSLFADRPSVVDGGMLLYNGKLALPPLNPDWLQVSRGDGSESPFKGGDLGIFQRMTSVKWKAIEKSLSRTLQFNEKRPPNIWTTAAAQDEQRGGWLFPYIQVSLISRADAALLMNSVREDIEEIGTRIQADLKEIARELQFDYRRREPTPADTAAAETFSWKDFLERAADDWKVNPQERLQHVVDAVLPVGDRLTFVMPDEHRLAEKLGAFIELYAYPFTMLQNCLSTLGKMSPETGLLIGRLLYYCFGVADGGKIDVQQLSWSYEGAFAQIRTETAQTPDASLLVTNDHVLILATKSDFCLVHVHIPMQTPREERLDVEAQNWIKNIRMALLR